MIGNQSKIKSNGRHQRLADSMLQIISESLVSGDLEDPRLTSVVLTRAKMSPDLQILYLYFRSYDPSTNIDLMLKALIGAAGYFRYRIADELEIKRIPSIKYFYDESFEHRMRIDELLASIQTPH